MIKTFEYTLTDCSEQSGSGVEGFETVLETTDRKERKDLVENESLKDPQGSIEKRNGSIRPGDRGGFARLQEGNYSRALPEGGNDIQPDGLVVNVY